MTRKRFALVGVGGRSRDFIAGLINDHADTAELVACCDLCTTTTATRLQPYTEQGMDIAIYHADDFDTMIRDCRIDIVIVTTTDAMHDEYICRAMELGCDTITEKPLTTTVAKCQRILDTQERTGKECRVGFNYRYSYGSTHIKHLLMSGVIGKIISVNTVHGMNYEHGPFYFHRWHGESAHSGGLLVHKVTHYFDLANWYLSDLPDQVYARGERNFFKPSHAAALGTDRGATCSDCPSASTCPFYIKRGRRGEGASIENIRGEESGYYRDQCVFRDSIDTPDTWHVTVNYRGGAIFSYSNVAFHAGKTGWYFRGTHGSMAVEGDQIHITPYYGDPYTVEMWKGAGGHGGGDPRMLADLYAVEADASDPYKRFASHHAGVWSVLTGIAAHQSIDSGAVIRPAELVRGLEEPEFPVMLPAPAGFETSAMRAWVDKLNDEADERKRANQRTLADTFGADG